MSNNITTKNLLEAKVHFGHMAKKWNPKMSKFILMKKNNLHVIDLNKTVTCLNTACDYLKDLTLNGKKIIFVGTKEQAKSIISSEALKIGMPFVTERWLGGALTNFFALKKLIKKWQSFEKMSISPTYKNLTKKEQLTILREKNKLSTLLSGLTEVSRLPSAMFVVDIKKEHIAVREAKILGIPIVAMVDTNVDPDLVDIPIPSNDDSVSSIDIIVKTISAAMEEGLKERLLIKQKELSSKEASSTSSPTQNDSNKMELSAPIDKKQIDKQPIRIKTNSDKISARPSVTINTLKKSSDTEKNTTVSETKKIPPLKKALDRKNLDKIISSKATKSSETVKTENISIESEELSIPINITTSNKKDNKALKTKEIKQTEDSTKKPKKTKITQSVEEKE